MVCASQLASKLDGLEHSILFQYLDERRNALEAWGKF
jgi:hypothetical protein